MYIYMYKYFFPTAVGFSCFRGLKNFASLCLAETEVWAGSSRPSTSLTSTQRYHTPRLGHLVGRPDKKYTFRTVLAWWEPCFEYIQCTVYPPEIRTCIYRIQDMALISVS